jgi:hypothetical protein
VPSRLFTPSEHHVRSTPRIDTPGDIRDVLAIVTLHTEGATRELVIGLDEGRVIRVVATRELPSRARAQLAHHERVRPRIDIHADELYVMDVQAVERLPDAPGADDPLFLYGVLRGPYPDALLDGVYGIEGQLATARGPLLDGLAFGIQRSFVYEVGHCGTSCTHAALPVDIDASGSVVLAFPLVPMGDDGSNELVAAQLIHEVLGALRTDLGDDLASDPVPVPNRAQYERDLVAAGWTIRGDTAIHRGGKSRFASLFAPARKQKLPRQIALADYVPLVAAQLARLPGWPEPERRALHHKLGLTAPERPRAPRPAPQGSFEVRGAPAPPAPRNQQSKKKKTKRKNRTVATGLTAPRREEWIKDLVDEHAEPGRPKPRVARPARAAGASIPGWMLDYDETDD